MLIFLDLEAVQHGSRTRGIGPIDLALAKALARNREQHQLLIGLSTWFPETIDPIIKSFDGLLPKASFLQFSVAGPVAKGARQNSWRAKAAEVAYQKFLNDLAPDVVITMSLSEGGGDYAVTTAVGIASHVPTAVVVHDFIPLPYKDNALLKKGDLVRAVSPSVRRELVEHLDFDPAKITVLSEQTRLAALARSDVAQVSTFGWDDSARRTLKACEALVAGQAKPPPAKDVTSEFIEAIAGITAGAQPSESDIIALAIAVDENEREVRRLRGGKSPFSAEPAKGVTPNEKLPLPQRLLRGAATWVVTMATATHDKRPGGIFAKLRTIDFAHIGLGDNLMAWAGLHALLINAVPVLAPGCTMYVPADMAALAAAIFSRFGLRVEGVAPHSQVKAVSPVFSPLPPEKLMEWYKTYIGIDWRMNCFEALDLQKSMPRLHFGDSPRIRLRLRLSERILYRRRDWQSAQADYIGYRLWLPVARKLGITPLPFLAMMKRALVSLRTDVAKYIEESVAPGKKTIPDMAIFPAGKSFQAFSPVVCKALRERLPAERTRFYIQSNDPWIDEYRAAGIEPFNLDSIEEVFWIVKSARRVLTTDSFSSHVAQLLRDDFVLTLTRDFRENIVHPGANPLIIANHPPCAPCNYHPRGVADTCLAGFTHCIAFDSPTFIGQIVRAMRAFPEADAPSGLRVPGPGVL
jgi:hypothetical protein